MLELIKSVDISFADIGDTLTYTIAVENVGALDDVNITFIDTIPNGTTFVAGSLEVDTVPTAGDLNVGIPLSDMVPGDVHTVVFQVTVDEIPTPNPISNIATADYENSVGDPFSTNSNTALTRVRHADLIGTNGENFVKSADKEFAEVGSEITYTYNIRNTGNVDAINVVLTDPIPNGTSFVAGSTRVNGLPSADSPVGGISLPNIIAGSTATVSFKVLANSIPVPNPTINQGSITYDYIVEPQGTPVSAGGTSNQVEVEIEQTGVDILKSVDKSDAIVGEELVYTVTVSNTGTVTLQEVIFTDQIPAGTTLVENSVTVDGSPRYGESPATGVNIGDIEPISFVTVEFRVLIVDTEDLADIENQGEISYEIQIEPGGPIIEENQLSNIVLTNLERGELTLLKEVDKESACICDTLSYTIVINNTGTVTAENIVLTDIIPEGLELEAGSLTIDGVPSSEDLNTGISIPDMIVGDQVVVRFNVLVCSRPCLPQVVNQAATEFTFTIPNRTETFTGSATSNSVETDVELIIFKQISVDETIEIPSHKPDAEDVLDLNLGVEVLNVEIIRTPVTQSYEGQILTGWKLIFTGALNQVVSYIANTEFQDVHGVHYQKIFSTFLVLPPDYDPKQKVYATAHIEDVFVELLDKRTIFKNVTLLIKMHYAEGC